MAREKFVDLFTGKPSPRMEAIMRRMKEAKAVGPEVLAESEENIDPGQLLVQEIEASEADMQNMEAPREIQSVPEKKGLRGSLEQVLAQNLKPQKTLPEEMAQIAMEQVKQKPRMEGQIMKAPIAIDGDYVGPISEEEFQAMLDEATRERERKRRQGR